MQSPIKTHSSPGLGGDKCSCIVVVVTENGRWYFIHCRFLYASSANFRMGRRFCVHIDRFDWIEYVSFNVIGLKVEDSFDVWELRSRYCSELRVHRATPLKFILIVPISLLEEKVEENIRIFACRNLSSHIER